jgi:hypothetical protein
MVLGFVAAAPAEVLWDQSALDLAATAVVDQEFGDFPDYSTYQVADIVVPAADIGWEIQGISTYFHGGAGIWTGVTQARMNIFPKTGALPAAGDNPQAGLSVPVTVGFDGTVYTVKASGLSETVMAGQYWVGLTPIADFGIYGQQFHSINSPQIGDPNAIRNPGGAFGFGTSWINYGMMDPPYPPGDGAIKIEGIKIPEPASLSLLALAALAALRRR